MKSPILPNPPPRLKAGLDVRPGNRDYSERTLSDSAKLVRGLSLLDSILLLAGGLIGSGIFLTAAQVASNTRTPALFLSIWVVGMVITLLACFAFAEMGAMFPQAGGQYVYLREAYGELVAFLYGWMIFTVGVGGTIAALAAGFAQYVGKLLPALSGDHVLLNIPFSHGLRFLPDLAITPEHLVAIAAIAVQTLINIFGVRRGALLQNLATWAKFGAIGAFIVLGVLAGRGSWRHYAESLPLTTSTRPLMSSLGVALIAVFWAYDGWVYITWLAGEVKEPQKTLPRTLVFGLLIVGAVYLAMNVVYLYALPMTGIAANPTVAQAAAASMFSAGAARWLALVIAVSCFGAMAACIMSGARVYYAMAEDGVFFRALAKISPRRHTPARSLILQGIWAAALVLSGGYDALFTYVMFMMVLSYALTVAALFVLRRKMPDAPRPYRCAGYPWLPGLYVAIGAIWTVDVIFERTQAALWGIFIVALGLPFYAYWKRSNQRTAYREHGMAKY
jgi:basic amino acid/polyamine antiporter, APA family